MSPAIDPYLLSERTVMVTGASSGIGRETVRLAASLGAKIVAVGRDRAALEAVIAELPGEGHICAPFDLTKTDQIVDWLKSVKTQSPILGIAHFAGENSMEPLRRISPDNLKDAFELHVSAAVMLVRGLTRLKPKGHTLSVVLASSVSAARGQPALLPYATAKAALGGVCRTLAVELAPRSVRINTLTIGYVADTRMNTMLQRTLPKASITALKLKHPLGFGSPRDPAYATCFLMSDAARWITGADLPVDGGFMSA